MAIHKTFEKVRVTPMLEKPGNSSNEGRKVIQIKTQFHFGSISFNLFPYFYKITTYFACCRKLFEKKSSFSRTIN